MELKPIRFSNLLAGSNTNRELGRIRLYSALDWTFRWQLTTAALIADLLGSTDRRHYRWLTSWERQGLIRRTPTLSPIAREIVTLTPLGVSTLQAALASVEPDELLPRYQHDVSRLNLTHLTHSLATQIAVLLLVTAGKVDRYATEQELAKASKRGVKQPDALLGNGQGVRVALEVELSPKSPRLLDQAIAANLRLIDRKQVSGIWYVSHVPAILTAVQRVLDAGRVRRWERDNQYKWSRRGYIEIPPHTHRRFNFRHMPELARLYA